MSPKKRQDEEIKERAHPVWIFREIFKATAHLDPELQHTIFALYAFNYTFIEAELVREGQIRFDARVSQPQLAQLTGKVVSTVQRRLYRLKQLGILDWTPTKDRKSSNDYTVFLTSHRAQTLPEDADDEIPFLSPAEPITPRPTSNDTASGTNHTAFSSESHRVQALYSVSSLSEVVEPLSAKAAGEHTGDHFVETPSGRPGEPGPVVPKPVVNPEESLVSTPVRTAPPAHTLEIPPHATRPYYTEELKLHKWPSDDLCNDGTPSGPARCLVCDVKAADVRRKGTACVNLSRAFEIEN